MAINITTEQIYDMDISERPFKDNRKYNSLVAQFNPHNNGINHDTPPAKDLISARASEYRTENVFGESTWGDAVKSASLYNGIIGGAAGGAVSGGLGYLAANHLLNKYIGSNTEVGEWLERRPFLKDIANKSKGSVAGSVGLLTGALGFIPGFIGGAVAKKHNHKTTDGNRYYGDMQQYDPNYMYDPEMYKYGSMKQASDDHIFITDTNIDPFPKLTLPDDINHAVNMQHPYIKYLPISTTAVAAVVSAVKDIILNKKLDLGNIASGSLLGVTAGSILKNQLEKHYSRPYMKSLAKSVDQKFKMASDTHEFISDTKFTLMPSSIGPKDIESTVEYKHPYINSLPATSIAGALLTRAIMNKGHLGMPDIVGSTMVGGTLGGLARMLLLEHFMQPYKKKYIQMVKDKYHVKTASILDSVVTKTAFTNGLLPMLSYGSEILNHNPIMSAMNKLNLAVDLSPIRHTNEATTLNIPFLGKEIAKLPEGVHQSILNAKESVKNTIGEGNWSKLNDLYEKQHKVWTGAFNLEQGTMAANWLAGKDKNMGPYNRFNHLQNTLSGKQEIGELKNMPIPSQQRYSNNIVNFPSNNEYRMIAASL